MCRAAKEPELRFITRMKPIALQPDASFALSTFTIAYRFFFIHCHYSNTRFCSPATHTENNSLHLIVQERRKKNAPLSFAMWLFRFPSILAGRNFISSFVLLLLPFLAPIYGNYVIETKMNGLPKPNAKLEWEVQCVSRYKHTYSHYWRQLGARWTM